MKPIAAIGAASLLASGVLLLYAEPLKGMVELWNASPMYSYAFTVPFISAYILWSRRSDFSGLPLRPARAAGTAVIVAAFAALAVGRVGAVQVLQQFSLIVMIAGLVLFLFGFRWLRLSGPALLYLLFMVPFWDAFTEPLHRPFQDNSARLGVAMMHAVGVPAYREGTVIALSNVTIEVARACSGVNYLVAVLALALPLSYLRLRGWGRRLLLIGAALLISVLANGLRVALIGVLAHFELGSPLHGPFHVLHGLFVAAVGYVALFGGLYLLEERQAARPVADPASTRSPLAMWPVREACALALAFWIVAFTGIAPSSTRVALAMPLDRLPATLGVWRADTARPAGAAGVIAWDEADSRLQRRYRRSDGMSATVDVWYFEAQRQSHEIVNFKAGSLHQRAASLRITIPSGATPSDTLSKDNAPHGGTFDVNVVRFPGEIGLFWYVLDGDAEADQYKAKLRSLWSALTSGRSDGAAVMLRTPSGHNDERSLERLSELAAELHVALGRHWSSRPSSHLR